MQKVYSILKRIIPIYPQLWGNTSVGNKIRAIFNSILIIMSKKIINGLIAIVIFCSLKGQCQTSTIMDFLNVVDSIYASIDKRIISTGILLDQGFRNIDDLIDWKQTQSDYYNYWAIYSNLQRSKHGRPKDKFLPDFENLFDFEEYKNNIHKSIPLSYIFYKGNYLGADETLKLFEDKDYLPVVSEKKLFALSPLVSSIYSSSITFYLKSDLIFSNIMIEIHYLEIDFGDGNGFREVSPYEDKISINYDCIGEKSIIARLLTDKDTLIANTKFTVKSRQLSEPSITGQLNIPTSKTNNKSYLKSTGKIIGGDYRCELSSDNVLDKPILIIEGIDLLNKYSVNEGYSKWEGVLSNLRANGYDVFCLNFNDAKLSMHENVKVVKAMINKINEDKVGNFEGIVIGESMGGILARMALKEMENDNIDHQIGLYVSFDSPHKGANIPMGIQTGFRDALTVVSDVSEIIIPFLDIFKAIFGDVASYTVFNSTLNSTAAQQLLSRHTSGLNEFNVMQGYLKNLGYPENSRNVALINGSNQGNNLLFDPGDRIFNHQWKWTALLGHYHELTLNSTAVNTNSQLVSNITIVSIVIPAWEWWNYALGIPPIPYPTFVYKKRYYTSDNKAYDNCPGGIIEIDNCDIDAFSFVPTSSSIDLNESVFNTANGLNYLNATNTKDIIINNNLTPFDDIYANSNNNIHLGLDGTIYSLIEKELMFDNLFIQNRIINKNRDFVASKCITTGNDVDHQFGKNVKTGDVVFKSKTSVSLTSPSVILKQGTKIEKGCTFSAKPTNKATLKSAIAKIK